MKVEVSVTEGKGVRRVLEIRVPKEEIDSEYKKATDEVRKEANIPGFRPGKAPASVIQTRFREEIARAVMENVLPAAFSEALQEARIEPIGEPEIKDVIIKRGEPMTFRALVDIKPDVDPGNYKNLKLTRTVHKVTDDEVEHGIKTMRERLAVVSEVDDRPAREGDVVMAEMTKLPGGDHVGEEESIGMSDIELNKTASLPEFVDNLVGKSIGDEVEFTVKYPEDYFEKDFANYTYKYRANIKHIREKLLPESDEEFVERYQLKDSDGNPLPVEKIPDRVREDLQEGAELNAKRDMENQAVDILTKESAFDVPESILGHYLSSLTEDYKERFPSLTEDELRDKLKPMAEKFVRWMFIRGAIVEKEKITVEDEDLNEYREKLMKNTGMSKEDVERYIRAEERINKLKDQIIEEKVMNLIIENAEIEDKEEESEEEQSEEKKSIIITPEGK
ncbi:MAG: trigger factor [candidate division Zixibacteria bacterium]|nr:trigger factor [candidate division Zixibacteria bacterium]